MGSTRVASNRLAFVLDGVAHWADATRVVLDSEDAPDESLHWDPWDMSKRRLWFFDIEAIQSTAPGSLWRLCFDRAGQLVPFRYAVHGNATPTPDEPHLTGEVRITAPPRLGGEASVRGSQVFEVRLEVSREGVAPGYPVPPTLEEA